MGHVIYPEASDLLLSLRALGTGRKSVSPPSDQGPMTSLLWRAAACAGLAASGFTSLAQAQSTTVVMPPRTEYRRTLPAAETPIA